jgi:WD40 repeat protein
MEKIKVLLFAANPRGTAPLDLSREFREIDEEVGRGAFRDFVELILVPGTRPVDLLRKLNENQPQVVHFSSHGNPDELMLESGEDQAEGLELAGLGVRSIDQRDMKNVQPVEADEEDVGQAQAQVISKSALVSVLRSCNEGNLRLVVLNACDTRPHAEALTNVVDCVVSMNRAITDRAAIKFAASFYGALAFGRSVQKAFDQGVARLVAEGITESDTPELLVREGADAAQLVLVGTAPVKPAEPATEAPFIVPFPRNPDFVGRDDDLDRLRTTLLSADSRPVGIRPAGLTGMGGIGKTQLVVEYVYRHRADYPAGIFWIDAAGPLAEGFARLATDHRLRWADNEQPRDEQIRAAFAALNSHSRALVVLDNLPDPAAIAHHMLPDCVPEDLRCRVLFTTRRHDLGRFRGIEVTVLPEEPALRLLLRHPSRQPALDPADSDHEHARAIARMLGRLPLALELAGAYLGKFSGDVSLADYREGLRADGALATLDADATDLSEADLRRVHDPAVAATIGEQWSELKDESARMILRVASLFSESAALPIVRLGLLAGLTDEARPGRSSALRRALRSLDDSCLIERLEGDHARLHPLIRDFACRQIPVEDADDFRRQCTERAANAIEDFAILEASAARRGVDGLQEDLIAILEVCPPSGVDIGVRVKALLRLLQLETHHLRVGAEGSWPVLFAQQVRNRAFLLGIGALQCSAEGRLSASSRPHFRLRWTASRQAPALVLTLAGHADWVNAVAVTPDGRFALSGSHDRTLKLWNLTTGQPRMTLMGHTGPVYTVSILPDGCHALSGSTDGTVRLWDLSSGETVHVFSVQSSHVYALAVAPDGRRFVTGSRDGTLDVWNLATDQPISVASPIEGFACAATITPDGQQAIVGFSKGSLMICDLRTGVILRTIVGHEGPVYALAITPDGRHVLSGSFDGELKLWDLQRAQFVFALPRHKDDAYRVPTPIYALAMTPDGRCVLAGCGDSRLRLWDLVSAELRGCFGAHGRGITSVAVTPDGRYAVSGSTDETLKLWDLATPPTAVEFSGHEKRITVVAVMPDGCRALSGSRDSTLRIWDLRIQQSKPTIIQHGDWVTALAVTPNGSHAVSGREDGVLRVWDLQTGELCGSMTGHTEGATAVVVTPDGCRVLSASYDGTLRLWDFQSRRHLLSFEGNRGFATALAITPDGKHAISGFIDGTLKLWNLETGQLVRVISRPKPPGGVMEHITEAGSVIQERSLVGSPGVNAVAVTPDGTRVISSWGDSRGDVEIWDLLTGELCLDLVGHREMVAAVAITPNGRHAVSAAEDRTIRLWDLEQRVCRAVAPLENLPTSIALTPDGQTILVGDRLGSVQQFEICLR